MGNGYLNPKAKTRSHIPDPVLQKKYLDVLKAEGSGTPEEAHIYLFNKAIGMLGRPTLTGSFAGDEAMQKYAVVGGIAFGLFVLASGCLAIPTTPPTGAYLNCDSYADVKVSDILAHQINPNSPHDSRLDVQLDEMCSKEIDNLLNKRLATATSTQIAHSGSPDNSVGEPVIVKSLAIKDQMPINPEEFKRMYDSEKPNSYTEKAGYSSFNGKFYIGVKVRDGINDDDFVDLDIEQSALWRDEQKYVSLGLSGDSYVIGRATKNVDLSDIKVYVKGYWRVVELPDLDDDIKKYINDKEISDRWGFTVLDDLGGFVINTKQIDKTVI